MAGLEVGAPLPCGSSTLVARVAALRVNTLKKSIILAMIYVEILSQPILATTPILLKMAAPQILRWYGGSFGMHLIFALVQGAGVGYGLRLTTAVNHNRKNSSRRHISTGEDIDALAESIFHHNITHLYGRLELHLAQGRQQFQNAWLWKRRRCVHR